MEAALYERTVEDLEDVRVFTRSGGNYMRNKVQNLYLEMQCLKMRYYMAHGQTVKFREDYRTWSCMSKEIVYTGY